MHETLKRGVRAPRWRSVSEWSVRRKVAAVLALPLIVAVALGGLRAQSALDHAADASSTASRVTVLRPAVQYLSAAEDAAVKLKPTDHSEGVRMAAVAAVRDAGEALGTAAADADLSDQERELVAGLLDSTESLRDGSAYDNEADAVSRLKTLEADVSLLLGAMAGTSDTGARAQATSILLGQLGTGRLAVTLQQLALPTAEGNAATRELEAQLGVEVAAIETLLLSLPEDERVQQLSSGNADRQQALEEGASDLPRSSQLPVYDELADDLLGGVESDLASEASWARADAVATAVVIGLVLLVAVGLALFISHTLVGPIRRVRDGALAVANERLPDAVAWIRAGHQPGDLEPIDVHTSEEMGQLARAVDDLHHTAVRLAQDEAELRTRVGDMFVTLSRRSTSLVHQQLHLIEQLEQDEEDPKRLESLFRLDHLATRMRRTAESLVVLAEAPTQRSEQDSLTMTEALHAATAGVQDYQRVVVATAPRLQIKGSAAADVVHLLTELVDNALSYSPPTAPVTVTTTAPRGMALVEIRDAGLGLDSATLAELNAELRSGGRVTQEATRRMGLLVVSRLARRHGVTVLLDHNPEGGVTARVYLPRPVLTGIADLAVDDDENTEAEVLATSAAPDAPEEGPDETDPRTEEVPAEPVAEPAAAPVAEPVADAPVVARPFEGPSRAPARVEDQSLSGDALSAVISANIGASARKPTAPSSLFSLGSAQDSTDQPEVEDLPDESEDEQPAERLDEQLVSGPADDVAATADPEVTTTEEVTAPVAEPDPALALGQAWQADDWRVADEHPQQLTDERADAGADADQHADADVDQHLDAELDEHAAEVPDTAFDPEPLPDPATDVEPPVVIGPRPQPETDRDPEPERDLGPVARMARARGLLNGQPSSRTDDRVTGGETASQPAPSGAEDTPLFRMLRSSWFDGDSADSGDSGDPAWGTGEADAGWQAADRLREGDPSPGPALPVRRPGDHLVPGGVTPTTPIRRDPEAIKARLASHTNGVARGRSATSDHPGSLRPTADGEESPE